MEGFEGLLEQHSEHDRESFRLLNHEIAKLNKKVDEVQASMSQVQLTLQQQKGFIAGVLFVVSAIIGAVALAVHWLK